jgi:hypothetical protein
MPVSDGNVRRKRYALSVRRRVGGGVRRWAFLVKRSSSLARKGFEAVSAQRGEGAI